MKRLATMSACLTALACIAGCATYGWSGGDTDRALPVATVAVHADSGLDPGDLTRTLVDRLNVLGIPAIWADGPDAIDCSVVLSEAAAVSTSWSPTAVATCDSGGERFEGRGSSSASLGAPSNDGIRNVQQGAATDAVIMVADQMAHAWTTRGRHGEE